MCYQVHKGHSIRIWEDHLHPSIHSFRPVAREGTEPSGHILHVSDLINPEARQWDEALIRSIFDDQTGQAILNIHLSQTPLEDKIIWQPDGKGQFSTKSAYLTNNSVNFQDTGPLSTRQWNKLWSSNIQERLKTFLWRIAWDALPVRAKFESFHPQANEDNLTCPLCNVEKETVNHLFLSCHFSRVLWRNSPWPLDIAVFADKPIQTWIGAILSPHDSLAIPYDQAPDFLLFAVPAMDSVWFSRNRVVHGDEPVQTMTLLTTTQKLFLEHPAAWTDIKRGPPCTLCTDCLPQCPLTYWSRY